jgi:hypothetical protein
MAHALPILTLDHQAAGAMVPDDAGIKDPGRLIRKTPWEVWRRAFAYLLSLPPRGNDWVRLVGHMRRRTVGPNASNRILRWYVEVIEKSRVASTTLVYAKP